MSAPLVTIWRVDGDACEPEETQAEEPAKWPGDDVRGRKIYDNTCFRDRAAAVEYLRRDVGYQIKAAARDLKENDARRLAILEEAARACTRHAAIEAAAERKDGAL